MAKSVHYDWHNQPQHVILGGKECKFKSKQEHKWAQYLERLKELNTIIDWWYEPRQFEFKERFRRRRVYTPDFLVEEKLEGIVFDHSTSKSTTFQIASDETVKVWHEVKTSLRQVDVVRFKYLAADYPNEKIILVLNDGTKNIEQMRRKENALRYVERIVYAGPIFRKMGIK